MKTIKFLIVQLFTLLNIYCGILAFNALNSYNSYLGCQVYKDAYIYLNLAFLFDRIDGRLARYLKVSSRFGARLDMLADFSSFGLVPGYAYYIYSVNSKRDNNQKEIQTFNIFLTFLWITIVAIRCTRHSILIPSSSYFNKNHTFGGGCNRYFVGLISNYASLILMYFMILDYPLMFITILTFILIWLMISSYYFLDSHPIYMILITFTLLGLYTYSNKSNNFVLHILNGIHLYYSFFI